MTKRALLAAVLSLFLLGAGCSSGSAAEPTGDDAAAPTTEPAAEDPSDAEDGDDSAGAGSSAASLVITAVQFSNSTVTLRNTGAEAVDLTGYFMCNRPSYSEMPSETVEAGETIDIDVSALGIDGSGGEFAVYRSSSYSSAEDIVSYVQWGQDGNGRASVAIEAGLIAEGDFVDNGGEDIFADQ